MAPKTWTTQADWQGFSSRSNQDTDIQVDFVSTPNAITLTPYMWITDFEEEAVGTGAAKNLDTNTSSPISWGSVSTDFAYTGTQSVKVKSSRDAPDGPGYAFLRRTLSTTYTDMTLEWYWYIPVNGQGSCPALILWSAAPAYVFYLNCGGASVAGNNFSYYNGSWNITSTAYPVASWVKMRLSYQSSSNTVKVWYNENLLGTFTAISNRTVKYIDFETGYAPTGGGTDLGYYDFIRVWNSYTTSATSYPTTYRSPATINYQYDSGEVGHVWTGYTFDWTVPVGGLVQMRYKTATSQANLAAASYTAYVSDRTGPMVCTANRWIEVQIKLSTSDTSVTPTVNSLTIDTTSVGSFRFK